MGFEHATWLFTCDSRNRGICRLNFDEAALLYRAVTGTRGAMLEVGRRHGGSTVLMLEASGGEGGDRSLVSLDIEPRHHPAAQAYFDRPAIASRVELLVRDSREPLDGRAFGMLFIDGDHSEEGVRADVEAHWASLVGVDGAEPLAVFHDAEPNDGFDHDPAGTLGHAPGVTRCCEALVECGAAERVEVAGSMLLVRKTGELSW